MNALVQTHHLICSKYVFIADMKYLICLGTKVYWWELNFCTMVELHIALYIDEFKICTFYLRFLQL